MPALPRASKYTGNNPAAFHVATSTTPRSSSTDSSLLDSFSSSVAARFASHTGTLPSSSTAPSPTSPSPAASLSATLSQLDLIERLASGPTPLDALRRAAAQLDPGAYADLLAERHAAGLCPYAACANAASEPYEEGGPGAGAAGGAARVRLRGGSLVRRGGAGDEADRGAYCSRRCRARSEHLAGEVARRRPGALLDAPPQQQGTSGAGASEVELLEDVERRREDVRRSTAALLQGARAAGADLATPIPTSPAVHARAEVEPGAPSAAASPAGGEARGATPAAAAPTPSALGDSLLSSLTIHERPTPSVAPSAPSLLHPTPDFESPLSLVQPRTVPLPSALSRPPAVPPVLPPQGAHGLSAPRFVSAPVMLDARSGAALEWAGVGQDGMDDGMTEEEKGWMWEALRVRDEARERGEVE
ncbi:hypothetical protein JCM9279_003647 [Rhodotorula babjevae]